MAPAWHTALQLSLLLAGAAAQPPACDADGLENRLSMAQDFAATADGKCNSKDACYAMMQMDQLCADGQFDQEWCNPDTLGDLGYYSPFKVKQSMIDGGNVANSAACSFGTMASLSRKGLITSNCAADVADPDNPHRGAIINMFTNYWCPYVLSNADLLCSVDHDGRETKFAVIDCDSVPFHIDHPDLLMANMTASRTQTSSLDALNKSTKLFMAVALSSVTFVGAAIAWSSMRARSQAPNDYEPLLAA